MTKTSLVSVLIAAVVLLAPRVARTQMVPGADKLSPRAVADSQAVLRSLDALVEANPRDAAAWYHRGMVAWALAIRARAADPPRELDATILGAVADRALRMAADLAPDSSEYLRNAGRYLLSTRSPMARSSATGFFDRAVEAARRSRNSASIFASATEAGLAHWRSWDMFSNRGIATVDGAFDFSSMTALMNTPNKAHANSPPWNMQQARTALESGTRSLPPDVNGGADYALAAELFREAYDAAPDGTSAFRSVAMVLADRSRWSELDAVGQRHLQRFPGDPTAWTAIALSAARSGNPGFAKRAFDSAAAHMDASERARVERLSRIRPRRDTSSLARGTAAQLGLSQQLYWMFADPLWSRDGDDAHTEFRARVAFADFRWSVDEDNIRGADTDRGDIYVRYGPPKTMRATMPRPPNGAPLNFVSPGDITTVWIYESGLMFAFRGRPTFAWAQTAPDDVAMNEQIIDNVPVRWDNIATTVFDTIPSVVSRFRGGPDSVDVFIATSPDVARLITAAPGSRVARSDMWLVTGNAAVAYRDSAFLTTSGIRTISRRVSPGLYVLRSEATIDQSNHAARSTSVVDASLSASSGLAASGFALSDLVLASRAAPGGGGRRWSDFAPVPIVDGLARNAPITLIWENYELGSRDGAAQYDVVVSLVPRRSALGRFSARVIGGLASAARIQRREDRIAIGFSRNVPHAVAFADQITISLDNAPAGEYQVLIQVTDRVTGRALTRTRDLTIRE